MCKDKVMHSVHCPDAYRMLIFFVQLYAMLSMGMKHQVLFPITQSILVLHPERGAYEKMLP